MFFVYALQCASTLGPTVKETSMDNDVRALREAKGLTQAQLGQELGVSRQSVNSIEKDKYDVDQPLPPTPLAMLRPTSES